MNFINVDSFFNFLKKDIGSWNTLSRAANGHNTQYKNNIIEKTQFFYVIDDATRVISNYKSFYQYPFWVISELLSEIFAMNPPIMYKYKPEVIEWAYKIKDDKSLEYMYGRRWQEWNQLLNIIELLKKRLDSKRAVIDIFTPYDTDKHRNDVPCTLMYAFKVRDNKLNMTTFFRSHDLFSGVKYDFILSSFINQLICMCVNTAGFSIQPGKLGVYEDSLHIYHKKDSKKLTEFLVNDNVHTTYPVFDIMYKHRKQSEIFDDLWYVSKIEESTYYGNFEYALNNLTKIKNPAFRDFAKVYYNRNLKFQKKELSTLKYETKVLKWKN